MHLTIDVLMYKTDQKHTNTQLLDDADGGHPDAAAATDDEMMVTVHFVFDDAWICSGIGLNTLINLFGNDVIDTIILIML